MVRKLGKRWDSTSEVVEVGDAKRVGGWGIKKSFWFLKSLADKSMQRLIHSDMLWGKVLVS